MVKKIFVIILLIGFLISSTYTFTSLFSINANSNTLMYDFSAERVSNIDEYDNIYLKDGTCIDGDSIDSYIKINSGEGTWYFRGSNTLAVETTYRDLVGLLGINLLYLIVTVGVVSRWAYRSSYEYKEPFIVIYVIYVISTYYYIFDLLSKVLNL